MDGLRRRIRIRRVHLEEDTAKLTHTPDGSLIDCNRAGVPLMEIVTEADIRSADEAHAYLTRLRTILRYLGVSTGDMEKGAMRCEANISLRPRGAEALGTKVEVKNLNSFRSVRNAIAYEIERQSEILSAGRAVEQVTMGWDEEGCAPCPSAPKSTPRTCYSRRTAPIELSSPRSRPYARAARAARCQGAAL